MPPLPDQQVIDKLAATGGIALRFAPQPTFTVDLQKVRDALEPEQTALVIPPAGAALPETRRIAGALTLPPPPAAPIAVIPTIILIGRNGDRFGVGGLPADGTNVLLIEPNLSGFVLIAAGGNGDQSWSLSARVSNGGNGFVVAGNECLVIALGGRGGVGPPTTGMKGGEGGIALGVGLLAGNDVYSDGGQGGEGGSGTAGAPGRPGYVFGLRPAVAGGPGGLGGQGGGGGKGYAVTGQAGFAEAHGGNGGKGGGPGPGGTGAAGFPPFGIVGAAAGAPGVAGAGGAGANIKVSLGPGSVEGTSAVGSGGGGIPAGTPGVREP